MSAALETITLAPFVLVFQDPQPGGQDAPRVVQRGDAPPPVTGGDGTGQQQQQQPQQQAPTSAQDQCMGTLPMLLGFVAIFYFLILRPQQKAEKKRKEMLAAIKKGDRVATSGGMHGVITAIDADTVTLRVDKDVKLTFDRGAIAKVVAGGEAAAGDAP